MTEDSSTDFLIIGAGFSGLVIGEQLAKAGWKCVVVDRRSHLGGMLMIGLMKRVS